MVFKWVLSEKCTGCSLCGPRGTADGYGLGSGVYPRERFPRFPAHFGCNCRKAVLSD